MTQSPVKQLLVVAVAVSGALAFAASAQAQPALSFSDDQVTVSELTPGCEMAYLAIARERRGWTTYRTRQAGQAVDEDLDGVISIDVAGGVPVASVWVAVDLEDGATALGAPGGPVRLAPEMLPSSVEADGAGELQSLQVSRGQVRLLIVRPGLGSWDASIGDGAEGDLDGEVNGLIDVDLSVVQPVEEHVADLGRMQAGDVVVVLDPRSLEVAATRVAAMER